MVPSPAKNEILQRLQKEILSLQGYKNLSGQQRPQIGLGPIEKSFPGNTFPTGAVHEFLSFAPEDAAATTGFITALLGHLMQRGASCLWIGARRTIFPPGLKAFGIKPEKIIFVDVTRPKDVLWTIEEALKCDALTAVVGEIAELNFADSRRLQLAVERSRVTGFIHRHRPKTENTIACVSRWKISSLASMPKDGLPGVGFPRWNVQLQKVRNGKPGLWQLEWSAGGFKHLVATRFTVANPFIRKAV